MFSRHTIRRGSRDEAEKPFWISFADLMTSLMVLFLVTLSVALVKAREDTERAKKAEAAAKVAEVALVEEKKKLDVALEELRRRERERDNRRELRASDIASCHVQLEQIISRFNQDGDGGVHLDRARNVIDFGSRALFDKGRNDLKMQQAQVLRDFTEHLIDVLNENAGVCHRWLKRVVVEGFTDITGSYLYNLNLSLNRSQRVMCVLLSGEYGTTTRIVANDQSAFSVPVTTQRTITIPQRIDPLPPEKQSLVKQLFLVGGYSSNSLKATDEESRRIELRIEFYQVDEERLLPAAPAADTGRCSTGGR